MYHILNNVFSCEIMWFSPVSLLGCPNKTWPSSKGLCKNHVARKISQTLPPFLPVLHVTVFWISGDASPSWFRITPGKFSVALRTTHIPSDPLLLPVIARNRFCPFHQIPSPSLPRSRGFCTAKNFLPTSAGLKWMC